MRLLMIAFLLEIGFVLTVIPWSTYWERNYFAEWLPTLHDLITNNFVRGAVSGLGLVNIGAGVLDLLAIFSARRIEEPIISIGRPSADE